MLLYACADSTNSPKKSPKKSAAGTAALVSILLGGMQKQVRIIFRLIFRPIFSANIDILPVSPRIHIFLNFSLFFRHAGRDPSSGQHVRPLGARRYPPPLRPRPHGICGKTGKSGEKRKWKHPGQDCGGVKIHFFLWIGPCRPAETHTEQIARRLQWRCAVPPIFFLRLLPVLFRFAASCRLPADLYVLFFILIILWV
jgi:hypothetical protein